MTNACVNGGDDAIGGGLGIREAIDGSKLLVGAAEDVGCFAFGESCYGALGDVGILYEGGLPKREGKVGGEEGALAARVEGGVVSVSLDAGRV